jgi:hypothetical protein
MLIHHQNLYLTHSRQCAGHPETQSLPDNNHKNLPVQIKKDKSTQR